MGKCRDLCKCLKERREAVRCHLLKRFCERTRLCPADFKRGTVRIRRPGHYFLDGDIEFDPNPKSGHCPEEGDDYSKDPLFRKGFPAAILIESSDVILDLNCHSISCSPRFALEQPKYSHIIIRRDFCDEEECPIENVLIHNGSFRGKHPRHAIEEHHVKDLLIEDICCSDFVVSAVRLVEGHNIYIVKCHFGPNARGCFKNDIYDCLNSTIWWAEKQTGCGRDLLHALSKAREYKRCQIDLILREEKVDCLIECPDNISSRDAYGILVEADDRHGDYADSDCESWVENLLIEDVEIEGIHSKVHETVTLSHPKDKTRPQLCYNQEVFPFFEFSDESGRYRPNPIGNLFCEVLKHCEFNGEKCSTSSEVMQWLRGGCSIENLVERGCQPICNGDSYFEVCKGVTGLRLDNVKGACISRIRIIDCHNFGPMGDDNCCGQYEKSHPLQIQFGYCGGNATGISVSHSYNVKVWDFFIDRVRADNGRAWGLRGFNGAVCLKPKNGSINRIQAGTRACSGIWQGCIRRCHYGDLCEKPCAYLSTLPNWIPIALAVSIEDCSSAQICGVCVDEICGVVTGLFLLNDRTSLIPVGSN